MYTELHVYQWYMCNAYMFEVHRILPSDKYLYINSTRVIYMYMYDAGRILQHIPRDIYLSMIHV